MMTRAASLLSYDPHSGDRRPILVVGDTEGARHRAFCTAEATGLDVLSELTPIEALESLDERVGLSALWIELDECPSAAGRRLLRRADAEARRASFGVVVSSRLPLFHDIMCELASDSMLELVIDGTETERLASMALACSPTERPTTLSDVASDASAARLRQLSEEVSRIANALSRLSSASASPPFSPATMPPPEGDLPAVSAEALRAMVKARRLRATYLPADLFADPAWDMLLDLLQAEIVQHRVPVSSLCIAAAVPATTALRWIKSMTERGLLRRRDDPHDGRRVFIEMAPPTSAALRRYFQDVGLAAV